MCPVNGVSYNQSFVQQGDSIAKNDTIPGKKIPDTVLNGQPKDSTNNVVKKPSNHSFEKAIGWNDAKDLKDARDNESYIPAAELYYYNGDVPGYHRFYIAAMRNTPDKTADSYKQLQSENREISLFTAPTFGISRSLFDISVKQDVAGFSDDNNDGLKQPWEKYSYNYNSDSTKVSPNYKLGNWAKEKTTSTGVSYVNPAFDIVGSGFITKLDLQGSLSVNLNHTDYNGTLDTRFGFYPFIDPSHPEYTPNYLKKLYGNIYTASKFGPVDSQDVSFGLALPMFGVLGEVPPALRWLCPIIVNKPWMEYRNTLTEMNISAFPNYAYSEVKKNLTSVEKDGLFVSDRQDIRVGFESRTIPIFSWPNSIYSAFLFNYKYSTLTKNMPDIYSVSDQNYKAPGYYKNVVLTQAQQDTIQNDYVNNYLPQRMKNDNLTANEVNVGLRLNFPGLVQLLSNTGIVNTTAFQASTDDQIKTLFQITSTRNDEIRNTSNGLYPANRDLFAEWHLNDAGNLEKVGSDFHAPMESYNGFDWNFSASHKLRLGHLTAIQSAWDKDYFKNYGADALGKSLWLIPSLVWPLVRFPAKLLDKGLETSTPIYMPIEFNIGGGHYSVDGKTQRSSNRSFSIGLGIKDSFTIKYRVSNSNNGYNYKDSSHSFSLIWQF
jgi:hypothetical protein